MENQLYKTFYRLAEQALSEITSINSNISGAYIYGSLATGILTPESDVDLVVLVDSKDSAKRSFKYYGQTPVDCICIPKACFGADGLKKIEPPLGMGLYYGIVLSDPQGILSAAQKYLKQHLFGPNHQGIWVKKFLESVQKQLQKVEIFIQEENWIESQVCLHETVLRLGQLMGYISRTPPNPATNLPNLAEASRKVGMPNIYEAARQVYSLPPSIQKNDVKILRAEVSKIYELILKAVVDSGKGEEEKEKASLFSPERPNRWDFVATKIDRLLKDSPEEGFSGVVWAAVYLSRMATRWIPERDECNEQILKHRNKILTTTNLKREIVWQRLESLLYILQEVESLL